MFRSGSCSAVARVPQWLVFHMVAPERVRVRFPRGKTRFRVFVADHLSLPIRRKLVGELFEFLFFPRVVAT